MNEEKQEYEIMYEHVMRNCKKELKSVDEVIEYLVTQCYFIDLYNDQLQEKLDKIKRILDIYNNNNNNFEISTDDLPF